MIKVISDKQNVKIKNVKLAKETLNIINTQNYISQNGININLKTSINKCCNNTTLYDSIIRPELIINKVCSIEVRNETTNQSIMRLLNEGKTNIAALNFASARNPGGGWLHGASAQEEDICRSSILYESIRKKPSFYNKNILNDNHYYTNDIIYSPNVTFIRDKYDLLLDHPFEASIITSPAPNLSDMSNIDNKLLKSILIERIEKIILIAANNNHVNLILGAWGCGVFGNDPDLISSIFMDSLKKYPYFDNVCFAVFDTREDLKLFNSFYKNCNV
jgi:uncharacterized protein (TIGR02452 family)